MFKSLSKLPEWRVLGFMAIIALAYYLFTIFSSFVSFFADVFLLLFLSWILAFLIDPIVAYLTTRGLSRTLAAALIYVIFGAIAIVLILNGVPVALAQLAQFSATVPSLIPSNSFLTPHIEGFFNSTLANSVNLAAQLASALTNIILIVILSFYFLVSKEEISKFILQIIPDNYEDDYKFLQSTLNTTFASFLRVQVFLGLLIGVITFVTLFVLKVDFALSTAIISALLAMIPVIGAILFLIPPLIAALIASPQKFLIVAAVLILANQLVGNILSPKLLGRALKIHPIVVLISFLIGYKIAGVWGAIFAVPVTSALAIIIKDVLKYWKQEADSK